MRMFDKEYKLMAVNCVRESGKPVAEVARELDINPNTLHGWISKFGKHGNDAFSGSGNLNATDEELRLLTQIITFLLLKIC